MRLATTLCVLAAFCLAGCASDKSFEKEILGHPAPESPTDTGWSRTPPPPPPPAPATTAPPQTTYAPAPATSPAPQPQAAPDYTPKPFAPAPAAAPAVEKPGAKLFEQQARQAQPPAPAPNAVAPAAPQNAAAPGERPYITFQVGEFAHAASGKQLMATLEAKGFSTRMNQGTRNNKPYYTVFAGREGSRAELEAALFTVGVTEPRLVSERPAASKAAPVAPAAKAQPAAAPAQKAPSAGAPKVSAPIAPPIVEPAPPLPDGYVPPPKKTGS